MLIIKLIPEEYLKNLIVRNLIKDYFYNNFLPLMKYLMIYKIIT